jgi:NAD(P)-dependent dehydrogenase (short-subunit alcohol dehydrogenase family)
VKNVTVVIGALGGIGSALADAAEKEGDEVIRLARRYKGADHIDLTDEASIIAAARHYKQQNVEPDRVIIATGILHSNGLNGKMRGPEKSLNDLDPEWLAQVYQINAIGPALVAKHFIPIMPRKGRAVLVALGARVGSISDNRLGGWYGYRASKAALHMMIRNIAIEWGRRNDQAIAVALHPGTVDTALSAPFQGNVPQGQLFDNATSATHLLGVLNRLEPTDSGGIFAWDGTAITP